MSVIGAFGVVLIVGILGISYWWLATSRANARHVLYLAVFGLVVGVICVFNTPVTEISFGKLASIRTSAEKAATDAGAITELKQRMETQAATLDQFSKKSDQVAKKTEEISRLVQEANEGSEKIRATSDFSFVLARASADDRKAFDELVRAAGDENHEFHDLARKAIVRVAGDLSSRLSFGIDWKRIGIDPATAAFADLRETFDTRPTFDQPAMLSEIWHQERLSKFDRLSFLYDIIKSTDSILVLNAACLAMNEECKINKNIIGYADYLKWWVDHAGEYAKIRDSSSLGKLELPPDSLLATPAPQPSPP